MFQSSWSGLVSIIIFALLSVFFASNWQICESKVHDWRQGDTIERFVEEMFRTYRKINRPHEDNNKTSMVTTVHVQIVIENFGDVSVQEMSYSVHLFVQQFWYDPRLKFTNYPGGNILLNTRRDELWLPDLYFPKAVDKADFTMYSPSFSIWLQPDGKIVYTQLLAVKLSCMMYLYTFPLDEQKCPLEISTFAYEDTEMQLSWLYPGNASASVTTVNLTLNEFKLMQTTIESFSMPFKSLGHNISFSHLKINMIFSRKFGFYMIYTYLPSMLIMTMCWLSFFVDFKVAPARISVSLLSVLSLITQCSATIQNLPRISYIKSMDVWTFSCLAFVVASLIEFAMVNSLCREETPLSPADRRSAEKRESIMGGDGLEKLPKKRFSLKVETGYTIDKVFRIVFPLAFVGFNVFYWTHYTSSSLEPHINPE